MVKQGFTLQVLPVPMKANTYHLWLYSTLHEDGHPHASRQVDLGEFQALPGQVSARDFSEWLDAMAGLAVAQLRSQLTVTDMASVSAATQHDEEKLETLPQDM